jgi:cytochrome c
MGSLLINGPARAAVAALAAAVAMSFAPAQAAGDPAQGAKVFQTNCSICHKAAKGAGALIGPNLYAVVGRTAGTAPGFAYSDGMKHAGFAWSEDQLVTFVGAPGKLVRGTRMTFAGLKKPGDAEAVVAYLKTLQ